MYSEKMISYPATSAADMTDGVSYVVYNEYRYMPYRYEKTYGSDVFERDSENNYIPQEVSFNVNWTDCTTMVIVIRRIGILLRMLSAEFQNGWTTEAL